MRTLLAVSVLCFAAAGCKSDDSRPAECTEITEACHPVDPNTGPIHECHEKSEEGWTKAECMASSKMCLELCKAAANADAGSTADASAAN